MNFFTADEHFGHENIIKYCNRPFRNIGEMDSVLIENFNLTVSKNDVTIHAGDFAWKNEKEYLKKLNGTHIFLKGSHDHWLPDSAKYIYEGMFDLGSECQFIVVCHYAMRVWVGLIIIRGNYLDIVTDD